MLRRFRLDDLCAALRGERSEDVDWMSRVALANRTLVTSELARVIAAGRDEAPFDVQIFLEEVAARNRLRNEKLYAQLLDAISALNASGIKPVALKGAALWVAAPASRATRNRMLVDLDLLVRPDERACALAALGRAGFSCWRRNDGDDVHVFGEMAREGDVATIDLHQRPAGPPGLAEALWSGDRLVEVALASGGQVRVPTPETYVFLLTLHDQFHDSGYWTGRFNLRHLIDIAALTRSTPNFDWPTLFALCRTGLTKDALFAELLAAERLFGAHIPIAVRRSAKARWNYARMHLQMETPATRSPIALAALAADAGLLWSHQASNRRDRKALFSEVYHGEKWQARLERIGRIFG